MTFSSLRLAIAALFATVAPVFGEWPVSEPTANTGEAALQGLSTLKSLTTEADLGRMGIQSLDQIPKTQLGRPIPICFISLNRIRNFEPGSDPNALLKAGDAFLYPVKIGPLVVSSLLVKKTDEAWKTVELGDIDLAKTVTSALLESAKSHGIDASRYLLIEIRALNLYFLAYRDGENLLLQSIYDLPNLDLKAGVEEPAGKIFEALKPLSQKSYEAPS